MYLNINDIYMSLFGGTLISLSTTFHLLFKGRITGFSGIVSSIVNFDKSSMFWKIGLMSSVICSSCILYLLYHDKPIIQGANPPFDQNPSSCGMELALGGLLVGLGTKLGSGCTSGHGVCGLPRLSKRSIVAVCTFMATGVLTATIKQQVFPSIQSMTIQDKTITAYTALLGSLMGIIFSLVKSQKKSDAIIGIITGALFGTGLVVSGMVKPSKVKGFLTLDNNWDPSLMFVMASAVGLNLITFNYIIHGLKKPLMAQNLEIPTIQDIDSQLVGGAALFGVGWGIGGICPGPAFAQLTQGSCNLIGFLGSLVVGLKLGDKLKQVKLKQ